MAASSAALPVPLTPAQANRSCVRLAFQFETKASPRRVWQMMADTDRFNRACGLDYTYTEEPQGDGTTRRIGHGKKPAPFVFDELPFRWREGRWFRIERVHRGTPIERVVIRFEVTPRQGGGSGVRYTVEQYPRNILLWPLVWLIARFGVRPGLEKALAGVERALGRDRGWEFPSEATEPKAPPLEDHQRELPVKACDGLQPSRFGMELRSFLEEAPLSQQEAMHPLVLGPRWGLSREESVKAFLGAVRAGVLSMRWDLLCPSCRGSKVQLERLGAPVEKVHCPSCNIHYDATFPDSVGVSFRPAPQVRNFDLPPACLGSPARTPHLLARFTVMPGDTIELELPRRPGTYRVRSWPPIDTALITVRPPRGGRLRQNEVPELVAMPTGFGPHRLELSTEEELVKVSNELPRPIDVVLEFRASAARVLTAGQLLSMPGAQELLPEGAIDPSFRTETLRGSVLAAQLINGKPENLEELAEHLRIANARTVHIANDALVACFLDFPHALAAARSMQNEEGLLMALSEGPVLEMQWADAAIPSGAPTDEAISLLPAALPGEPALAWRVADDQKPALDAAGVELVDPGFSIEGLPGFVGLGLG